MLNRLSDLVRLRTFASSTVQPASPVNMDALRDLMPGDHVRAHVRAAMPDGTYQAAIRGQPFLLRLPFAAHAGDILNLSVVAREPQLTFAATLQEDATGTTTQLSETARFIAALLDETEKLPLASLVRTAAPLLTGPPLDSAHTASALRSALAQSGMFYEAHQAEWASGEREFEVLLMEPQARLKPLLKTGLPARPARGGEPEPGAVIVMDTTPRLPQLPVHRDALAMIKQQLDTLESGHIAWHGLIWNGQPLDWDVGQQPNHTADAAGEPPWRTRLRLTLPRLGKIDATMLVTTHGVSIALQAADDTTQSALADKRELLQQSLRDAGVTPLAISVRGDETA